jgi:alpha-ketoglutarate-dependent taurine dioxygenase
MPGFEVKPIAGTTFGATVTGLKLAAISDEDFTRLYSVWLEYGLLIFPGQHLS